MGCTASGSTGPSWPFLSEESSSRVGSAVSPTDSYRPAASRKGKESDEAPREPRNPTRPTCRAAATSPVVTG
jgi:hypothetical protein